MKYLLTSLLALFAYHFLVMLYTINLTLLP